MTVIVCIAVQSGLVREVECLKDQVDSVREQLHNLSLSSSGGGGGRWEGEPAPPGPLGHSLDLLDHSYTVSQPNLAAASLVSTAVQQ